MATLTGTGTGGESCWGKPFKDECTNKLRHTGRGVLSMANSGPNTNGSQFFITFKSASHLDDKHTVFGRVVGGLDTLAKVEKVPTDKEDKPTTEQARRTPSHLTPHTAHPHTSHRTPHT